MIGHPKQIRIENRALLDAVKKQPCTACGRFNSQFMPVDPDHVSTRGAGNDDTADNVWALCREHHDMKGQMGLGHMIETFIGCRMWLNKNKRSDIYERIERTKNEPNQKKHDD